MKDHDIQKELLEKYLQNTCSPQEVQQLLGYFLRGDEAERQMLELMQQQLEAPAPYEEQDPDVRAKLQQALAHIRAGIRAEAPRRQVRMQRWVYAAAALLIAALATTFYFIGIGSKDQSPGGVSTEIQAGYNQATLTLADGRMIHLDSAQSGIIISNGDIKYNDGDRVEGVRNIAKAEEVTQLTLSTPKGGQYQVILSDGTKVWLNAASTLTYPSRFIGGKREVEVEGEAYFNVAKSAKYKTESQEVADPFIVRSKNQEIHVLGTEFNLSAFADEEETKTTLIEGKVRVTSLASHGSQLLAPHQQSVLKGDSLMINQADIDAETGWHNGLFIFHNAPLSDILKQLSRWYGLDADLSNVPDKRVYGEIPRSVKLSEVLELLENSSHIQFEIHNRLIHLKNQTK